jgi:hypothetical protein
MKRVGVGSKPTSTRFLIIGGFIRRIRLIRLGSFDWGEAARSVRCT